MNIFCKVSSYFIDNGGKFSSPVAYTKDNKGNYEEYKSSGNKTTDNIKAISVIANENTASASECLIGAMLYYKDKFDINRLIIENQEVNSVSHTFGKGIMQTTYRLSNGGGLKLTTAIIYQPDKSTCIHGKGIVALEENSVKLADGIAIKRANEVLKG
jgi:carboxyl-terminal processing protease